MFLIIVQEISGGDLICDCFCAVAVDSVNEVDPEAILYQQHQPLTD